LRPKLGLWWRRRGHAAELGGGGCGRRNSGDRAARSEQHVAQGGIGDPRDKVGAVGRWWHGLEPRARRWGRQWQGADRKKAPAVLQCAREGDFSL
jgi:hypothetical protein